MRAVVQRVVRAGVRVDGECVGEIERGLLVLVGVGVGDTDANARRLAEKIVGLRIFADDSGRFDRSLVDVGGAILAVSQFTLYADTSKGRRPSFVGALGGEPARELYEAFVGHLRGHSVPVECGRFGADMEVALINDGPVTIIIEHP